ncbi:RNA polymerase sigma factor [Mycobacterium sp. URHB0044]|uniref:RNA polymerase sigma factor n=1 Tax=Mycobacterium sp. URHB0044 TaxID=1380386 RepID=UPI0006861903|nr:sigma-70 family RNA polymerase sigma factor [Mycobacterium sp. URHB0044]
MTSFARSSASGLDDATLARSAAAGDRAAFAEIYDRYADRLHDFCVGMLRDREAAADCVQDVFVTAATKLVQLREPDRLRSWLYAIARSEALARIRDRKREQLSEELPEMPSGEADMATLAARNELADLIRDASGGLSDRDRVVLELAYRQGLDGPELADALGVTARNANTLVERLRETIARSLGALLLCRGVKADPDRCPELAAILDGWDGQLTPLMRKRVARHIDGCAVCEEDRARMVSPAALLGASPLAIPAPTWLRGRTLDRAIGELPGAHAVPTGPEDDESWWPPRDLDTDGLDEPSATAAPGRSGRPVVRAGLGAALVLVGIGGAVALVPSAAFRVVPADSRESLAPPTTTTTLVTSATPSIAQRTAPSTVPSTLPPAVVTTTTAVVIAPATTDEPVPAEAPKRTTEPESSTKDPITTKPKTTTKTTQEEEEEPQPPPIIEEEPSPPPPSPSPSTPKPTKPKPPVVTKAPPADVSPDCPQTDPTCNGGGGPIFQ